MSDFSGSLAVINAISAQYAATDVSEALAPSDDMINLGDPQGMVHYLRVGRNAVELILTSLLATQKQSLSRILDLPCGFGRVTRHLAAAFPQSSLTVCDLYEDRIDFCARNFGAEPIKSTQDLRNLSFVEPFDVIWCGSLLTHLPKDRFLETLQLFSRSLAPEGIAIATTHGRFSPWYSHERSRYLANDAFIRAERDFYRTGFGYAPYPDVANTYSQDTYGISLSSLSFIGGAIEKDTSIRMVSFTERGWDGHQDVLVFRKSPIYN